MPDLKKNAIRRLFCCNYARLGDVYEAALKSGFPPETALAEGTDIISQAKYRRFITNLISKNFPHEDTVMIGLERLAFGRANDAAMLVFSENAPTPEKIGSLDLFNVSEIKKDKNGGVEVKLFDRQKALERIYEYASERNNFSNASDFIEALTAAGDDADDTV